MTQWVQQGAPWKDHWAYISVTTRPTVPEIPPIHDATAMAATKPDRSFRGRGAALSTQLTASPEADRPTLIRRLSLDLTGLPPTAQEVDAFVKDTSPDAYDKLVDRLLASPHFGERMAVWWLDLVRYADTIGFHSDNNREVWPYRDYVINAFNSNKRFDQFTREQLAGDLIPGSTNEQKVATCYNRLLETTEEGGAQPAEYIVKYENDDHLRTKMFHPSGWAQRWAAASATITSTIPIRKKIFTGWPRSLRTSRKSRSASRSRN